LFLKDGRRSFSGILMKMGIFTDGSYRAGTYGELQCGRIRPRKEAP